MPLCPLFLTSNFFPFQHLSSATQSAIDQGVSVNVDSIHFFCITTVLQSCFQGDKLLTNLIFSNNIPLPSVSIATALGYSLQISS